METTKVVTVGEGDAKQTPFAILAAVRNALPKVPSALAGGGKKAKKTKIQVDEPEADFSALTVKVRPSENFNAEAVQAEAKKRSEQVFGSAADYYKIKRRISELQAVDGIELTAQFRELRELLAEQGRIDAVLARQPKSVLDQFTVDLFLCELDNLQPRIESEVIAMMNRALVIGRARKGDWKEVEVGQKQAGKSWPGHVYFRTTAGERLYLMHIPSVMPGREGTVSGADKRIFKSLRSLVHRYLTLQHEQAEATSAEEAVRIAELRKRHGLPPHVLSSGKEGYYTLYIPDQRKERPDGWGEGVGVVQVLDLNQDKKGERPFLVIRAEDGAGCMKSWRGEDKGRWVALHIFWSFLGKKLQADSIPEVARAFNLDVCRKLLVATAYSLAQERKAAEEEETTEVSTISE